MRGLSPHFSQTGSFFLWIPKSAVINVCAQIHQISNCGRRCMRSIVLTLVLSLGLSGCAPRANSNNSPTAADAKKFIEEANDTLLKLNIESQQAAWVSETFITDDTS